MHDFVPDRFKFSHDYAMYLHDRLAAVVVEGELSGMFTTQFDVDSSDHEERLSGDADLFEWLERHDRSDVLGEVLLKTVFPALLSDFCHFIYEALICSKKAKLTVAFALLRKPLKDSLHYLEWLVADPGELLNTLYNQESNALSFNVIGSPERMKRVISKAISRCPNPEPFDADYIYDLRFEKSYPNGFDGMCNQAMHLITTKPPIQTLKQNFNFIFSGEEDLDAQWEALYTRLPLLLLYTTELVEVLLTIVRKDPMPDYAEVSLHKSIGFLLWVKEIHSASCEHGVIDDLFFKCPRCNTDIKPSFLDLDTLFQYKKLKCKSCGKRYGVKELSIQK